MTTTSTTTTSTTLPFTPMRRRDRAMTDEAWIRDFLHRAPFGTLATVARGRPFINSNIFVYDEDNDALYLHTARKGQTRSNVEGEDQVCFSVSEMGRLLPASKAKEFSVEYAGVMIFGHAAVLDDPGEARHALELLMDKYAPHLRPGRDYRPITVRELELTSVYRVAIEAWSGKKKEVEPDFPGAYRWEDLERLAAETAETEMP